MKKIYLLLCSMVFFSAYSQTTYYGNGKTGFGGVIGTGTLKITTTETPHEIVFEFTMGGADVNDGVVIYIDSKDGGITNTGGLTDVQDDNRKLISGFDGTNRSTLTFPSGFEPDFAISFKVGAGNGDDGFGGLWKLDNPSNLSYVNSANLTPINGKNAGTYTLKINVPELELSGNSFNFLVTLVSKSAWRSNEFIGDNGQDANIEQKPFTVTGYLTYVSTALPVTLTDFSATNVDNHVNLQWTTSQESNIDRYEILRSADGKQFDKIGSVSANNLATVQQYAYTDAQPLSGDNFYKLAIVGKDNQVAYSKIVSVKSNAIQSFKAYFTSSNRILKLELPSHSNNEWTLEINNTAGQKIFRTVFNTNGGQTHSVDLNKQLPAGVYAISLINNGERISKMILVK